MALSGKDCFPPLDDSRDVFTELPYAFLSWAGHAHQLKALASPLDSLARYLHVFMSSESFEVYLQCVLLTSPIWPRVILLFRQ